MLCAACSGIFQYAQVCAKSVRIVLMLAAMMHSFAFAQTPMVISEISTAELPPTVELGSRSNLYASTYENDLTITNANGFAVRDIEITCDVLTPSGTMVQRFNFTIPGIIPAKGQKIVTSHRFGYWPTQATSINCQGNHGGR